MVTYCMAGLFAVLGSVSLIGGLKTGSTPGVVLGLIWIALGVAIVLGERHHRAWKRKFEADCAESDRKHQELMDQLDADLKRRRAENEESMRQVRESVERAKAAYQAWLDEHWFIQIALKRSDVLPMTEEKAAAIRQEFMVAADQAIANIR